MAKPTTAVEEATPMAVILMRLFVLISKVLRGLLPHFGKVMRTGHSASPIAASGWCETGATR
jgi:hypothetical protein